MALLITGVGTLFYAAVSSVELVVEGTIRGYFGWRRMEATIRKLNGHYILSGYGRVGLQVAAEFALDDEPFVIIEQDPATVEECVEKGYLVLLGEASDEVLEEAGVQRARCLVAALDTDADNVFVVLSARKLNPKLHIVAQASSDESAAKLEIAGPTAPSRLTQLAEGGLPRSRPNPSSWNSSTSSRVGRRGSSSGSRSSGGRRTHSSLTGLPVS
jgi:voltage-gated potassium channel